MQCHYLKNWLKPNINPVKGEKDREKDREAETPAPLPKHPIFGSVRANICLLIWKIPELLVCRLGNFSELRGTLTIIYEEAESPKEQVL